MLNFPEILGNRKLSCYIRKTVTTYRILTATSSANFLTDDGSLSVVRSSAPSSSLQRLGTSDMSLKEVQVRSFQFGRVLGERCVYTTTGW